MEFSQSIFYDEIELEVNNKKKTIISQKNYTLNNTLKNNKQGKGEITIKIKNA